MNFDQVAGWLTQQVPPPARKAVLGYALQLAVADGMRQQAREQGVSEATLKVIEAAGPMLLQQLQALVGVDK